MVKKLDPINTYRSLRVNVKRLLGVEPSISIDHEADLEFHGNGGGGWKIVSGKLEPNSIVVDVGVGEDISFSLSLIRKYGCVVHGFDPTPRAKSYLAKLNNSNFIHHPFALGVNSGKKKFYLPIDERNVSGAINQAKHLKNDPICVPVKTLGAICKENGFQQIDLLKLDIESAEYDIIDSAGFEIQARLIKQLCIEFHHRWRGIGAARTDAAVSRLRRLGFKCVWVSRTTNEEYTFLRD